MLDAFLSLAGVKLKHNQPRTDPELAWATVAGIDGLRAARDGKPALSPIALAVGRLLATQSADVRGPRPAATDTRHNKQCRPATPTAHFEAARARAMHDLLAVCPAVAEQMPDTVALLDSLAADPEKFEVLDCIDPEAIEPLYASFEQTAVELLDVSRGDEAGDPSAQAALPLVEQRFERAVRSLAEAIESALNDASSRDASA